MNQGTEKSSVAVLHLRSLRRHIKRLVKDGPVNFWEKKWHGGTRVQLGLNGIGLSNTNHIAHRM